jgi:hypothetical protein
VPIVPRRNSAARKVRAVPEPAYPFVPKSNRNLMAGQFWAIPLANGRFACGRVMVPTTRIGPRVGFVAGLMDWVGEEPPTAAALAGRQVLDQGHAHIKTILQTGGQVLGCRDLAEDGVRADPDPESTYGFMFLVRLAERHFGSG